MRRSRKGHRQKKLSAMRDAIPKGAMKQVTDRLTLYVVSRGMPADSCPAAPCFDDGRVIHIQGNHSRPSCWGQATDGAAILAPVEMLTPELLTRMEQMHAPSCQRVLGLYLCALEFVTGMAGHAQVFLHRLTAGCLREDMVYDETRSCDGGQGVTIRALVPRLGDHAPAQRPGDASSRHPGLCNSSGEGTRCPRHFNNM